MRHISTFLRRAFWLRSLAPSSPFAFLFFTFQICSCFAFRTGVNYMFGTEGESVGALFAATNFWGVSLSDYEAAARANYLDLSRMGTLTAESAIREWGLAVLRLPVPTDGESSFRNWGRQKIRSLQSVVSHFDTVSSTNFWFGVADFSGFLREKRNRDVMEPRSTQEWNLRCDCAVLLGHLQFVVRDKAFMRCVGQLPDAYADTFFSEVVRRARMSPEEVAKLRESWWKPEAPPIADVRMRFSLRVTDDDGTPVRDAWIEATHCFRDRDGRETIGGQTDAHGSIAVDGWADGEEVHILVRKQGFYKSERIFRPERDVAGRLTEGSAWEPAESEREIRLRRIGTEASLVKTVKRMVVPMTNVWLGIDLEKGVFVSQGNGEQTADINVRISWDGLPDVKCRWCEMSVVLPRELDGACFCCHSVDCEQPYVLRASPLGDYGRTSFVSVERKNGVYLGADSFWKKEGAVLRLRSRRKEPDGAIEANYAFLRRLEVCPDDDGGLILMLECLFNPIRNDLNLEDAETAQYARRMFRRWQDRGYGALSWL